MGNRHSSHQTLYRRDNATQTSPTNPTTATTSPRNTTELPSTTYHCRLTSRKHASLNLTPTHTQHGQGTHFAYFEPTKTIQWCDYDTVVLTAHTSATRDQPSTPCTGLTVPVSAFTFNGDVVVDGKAWVQFTACAKDTQDARNGSGRLLVRTRKRRKDSGDRRSSVLGLSVTVEAEEGVGNTHTARWMHAGREWVLVWERSRRVVG